MLSGKSTIATQLEKELVLRHKKSTYVLDGDNIRHGLNSDLGFGPGDRQENIRRIGEVCNLFTDAGIIVLAAFVSPYKEDRDRVRGLLETSLASNDGNGSKVGGTKDKDDMNNEGNDFSCQGQFQQSSPQARKNFIEIYVKADVATCEKRDPKGLYKRARSGEIKNFTGIDAPFEIPENPEIVLNSGEMSVDDCVAELMQFLREGGYLSVAEDEG